jgi:hypothetical protein
MSTTLKKGANGKPVEQLQHALNALGASLKPDGKFGAKTEEAVRAFQAAHGLPADGEVDAKTRAAIVEWLAKPATTAPTEPEPAPIVTEPAQETAPAIEIAEPPVPAAPKRESAFTADGWYAAAQRCPAHAKLTGGPISAGGAVVHATERHSMDNLLEDWAAGRGDGTSAHFVIGRRAATAEEAEYRTVGLFEGEPCEYPNAGLVQTLPVTHGSKHAGGPNHVHGWLAFPPDQTRQHPNLHYIGIVLHSACRLQWSAGVAIDPWTSRPFDPSDVFVDERGKPWHRVTEYQLETLGRLLDDLDEVLTPFPEDAKIIPCGYHERNATEWALCSGVRFVGHATLDPHAHSDPGPQVMAWLRSRYE